MDLKSTLNRKLRRNTNHSYQQQWKLYVQKTSSLLAMEFWAAENGWRTVAKCYCQLNRLLPLLQTCSTESSFAEYFVQYTSLMARSLKLWRIDPQQPLLKRLLFSWAQNIPNGIDVLWQALSETWNDFKNILYLLRDIGNMPIQLDLLEILSLYFYPIHTQHDTATLFTGLCEFDWLQRRLKTIGQNVDMEYNGIITELNLLRCLPRNVISFDISGAFFNKVPVKSPRNNGESIGLTVDFNLGVRSISLVCSNSTFHSNVHADEEWVPCEFYANEMLGIHIRKSSKTSDRHLLYIRLRTAKNLCNIMCESLIIQLRQRNVAEMQKFNVFELFQIQGAESIITDNENNIPSTDFDNQAAERLNQSFQQITLLESNQGVVDISNKAVQHSETPMLFAGQHQPQIGPFEIDDEFSNPSENAKTKNQKKNKRASRNYRKRSKKTLPQQSIKKMTEVQIANGSLVSFSYRQFHSVSAVTTKEVSIQFLDKDAEQSTSKKKSKERNVTSANPLKMPRAAKMTTKKSRRTVKANNDSDSEVEILPVSRRMLSKRAQQLSAASNSETLQDLCRNNNFIDNRDVTIATPEHLIDNVPGFVIFSPIANYNAMIDDNESAASMNANSQFADLPPPSALSFESLAPIYENGIPRQISIENNTIDPLLRSDISIILSDWDTDDSNGEFEKAPMANAIRAVCNDVENRSPSFEPAMAQANKQQLTENDFQPIRMEIDRELESKPTNEKRNKDMQLAPMTPVLSKKRCTQQSTSVTSITTTLPESATQNTVDSTTDENIMMRRQDTHRFSQTISSILQRSTNELEVQVLDNLDTFQRSLSCLLNANRRQMQHTQHSMQRIDDSVVQLERSLDREREKFRACIAEAELNHTRFTEDVFALNLRWNQILAACEEVPILRSGMDATIRDLANQFGQSVWELAVQHTSDNIQHFLNNPNEGLK